MSPCLTSPRDRARSPRGPREGSPQPWASSPAAAAQPTGLFRHPPLKSLQRALHSATSSTASEFCTTVTALSPELLPSELQELGADPAAET